jgi:hypothetical protein
MYFVINVLTCISSPILSGAIYYKINKNEFEVVSKGITSISNVIKIRPAGLDLKHVGGQRHGRKDTIGPTCINFMHILQRTSLSSELSSGMYCRVK